MIGTFNESSQQVWDFVRCQRPNGTYYGTGGRCRKGTESPYEKWDTLAQGHYGKVSVNPEGTRVVKTLLTGKDGKKGTFGPHEVELATKMGELGHSPVIHSHNADHIEMDVAPGKPLWAGYQRGENEPVMNTAQAKKAGDAIKALHQLGYYHGDNHALQYLVNGNDVKLVDFGLSGKISSNPVKVMQDLSKIANLIRWNNPELAKDPYFAHVNKHLAEYTAIQGQSQKAKAQRLAIANSYIDGLKSL
jgi:tRNA A-37 threonylcarbamoyl transferase component Bud32